MSDTQAPHVRDETQLQTHFAFGDNWSSFASTVSDQQLESARASMLLLFDEDMLTDATMLDIGCGSGLHANCRSDARRSRNSIRS